MHIGDLVFPLVVIVFFVVAVALVRGCERIIGPDEAVIPVEDQTEPPRDVAA
jgi:hypothetical protein